MKKIVEATKYVVVLNDTSRFYYALCDTEEEAINYHGFGDFCGYAAIELVYPTEEGKDDNV